MNNEEVAVSNTGFKIISVGEWVLYFFLLSIPLLNIIMMCVWAFGDQSNPTKANFGKAALIWTAIAIVLYIIFSAVIFGLITSAVHNGSVNA